MVGEKVALQLLGLRVDPGVWNLWNVEKQNSLSVSLLCFLFPCPSKYRKFHNFVWYTHFNISTLTTLLFTQNRCGHLKLQMLSLKFDPKQNPKMHFDPIPWGGTRNWKLNLNSKVFQAKNLSFGPDIIQKVTKSTKIYPQAKRCCSWEKLAIWYLVYDISSMNQDPKYIP